MFDPTLLFFVALAGFLSYRLFTVLGTRGGHEPEDADRFPGTPPGAPEAPGQAGPSLTEREEGPLPPWVTTVRSHYPDFDPNHFLSGAKGAYEMIVQGFATGDLHSIAPYLAPDVLTAFEEALRSRAQAGQIMEVTLVGIEKAEVADARLEGSEVQVVVAFQSDQIRVQRDRSGEIVDGDPNRIDLVRDRWTFSRPQHSQDPNWILTATGGDNPS